MQVHPPAAIAASLGGEPKTEMWYVANAGPGAELFVGLKSGVTRAEFEQKIASQTVAECFHRIPVTAGDSVFLQSGRVHALGANIMIFEVQQNSDTTYRVFDWNRVDASGKRRDLHIAQSLASIDFNDFQPGLLPSEFVPADKGQIRPLVCNDLFRVSVRKLEPAQSMKFSDGQMRILGVVEGQLRLRGGGQEIDRSAGQFSLLPANLPETTVTPITPVTFLEIL